METRQKSNTMLKQKGESFLSLIILFLKLHIPRPSPVPSESASPEEGLRISVLMEPANEARLGNSATGQKRKTRELRTAQTLLDRLGPGQQLIPFILIPWSVSAPL